MHFKCNLAAAFTTQQIAAFLWRVKWRCSFSHDNPSMAAKGRRHVWLHLCLIQSSAPMCYLKENEVSPPKTIHCIAPPSHPSTFCTLHCFVNPPIHTHTHTHTLFWANIAFLFVESQSVPRNRLMLWCHFTSCSWTLQKTTLLFNYLCGKMNSSCNKRVYVHGSADTFCEVTAMNHIIHAAVWTCLQTSTQRIWL